MALKHIVKINGVSIHMLDCLYNVHISIDSSTLHIFHKIIDADCGKYFKKIEGKCVNISMEEVASTDIATKCAEINAVPLVTSSNGIFYQLKVFNNALHNELGIYLCTY